MDTRVQPVMLFLCTGNYYRSRFAERLFLAWAPEEGLDWAAESRGLFQEPDPGNVGFMSPHAIARLVGLGLSPGSRDRFPRAVEARDLSQATRIIAIDETEHRSRLEARFPEWVDRVDFWRVHDIDRTAPEEALGYIEAHVRRLIEALLEASTGEAARNDRSRKRPLAQDTSPDSQDCARARPIFDTLHRDSG